MYKKRKTNQNSTNSIKNNKVEIIDSIKNTGKLEDEIEKKLISVIQQYKKKSK